MKTRYGRIVQSLLIASCLLVTTFFDASQVVAINGESSANYGSEVINENPDVTFTATGIATEPEPLNVISYASSNFLTPSWSNTDLDGKSIFKAWKISPDGSLATSFNTKYNAYAYPKANQLGIELSLPTSCNGFGYPSCMVYPLSDYAWVVVRSGAANDFSIVREGAAPVAVPGSKGDIFMKKETNELFIVSQSLNNYSWKKWNISDLAAGSLASVNSGFFTISPPNPAYGTFPVYSDGVSIFSGSSLGTPTRIRMATDEKEINLTTREVKSFRFGEVTPYKVESYTNMPIVPYVGALFSFVPGTHLYLSASFINRDPWGNAIFFTNNNDVYKFDSITGLPTYWGHYPIKRFMRAALDGLWGKAEKDDGHMEDNGGNSYWVPVINNVYINFITGEMTYSEPPGFSASALETDQNTQYYGAYNLNNFDLGDMYNHNLRTNREGDTVSGSGANSIGISDTKYLAHSWTGFDNGSAETHVRIVNFTPDYSQSTVYNEFFTFGQLINPGSQQISNGTISWSMRSPRKVSNISDAGLSFRIQDSLNMYRIESSKSKLKLVKIINGRRITLAETGHFIPDATWASYKIKISAGTHMKVYENNGLVMDVDDATFTSGTMGPYSKVDGTEFKGIHYQWSNADNSYQTPGVAIVDTAVTYATTYIDPEIDPAVAPWTQWKYDHIDPWKFLDAGDGKTGVSSVNGATVSGPVLSFDKVGMYSVNYRVPDDPHPNHKIINGDGMFQNYSKYADWYPQSLIVHRRPLAPFTIAQDATTHEVTWTDYSYDPDRCYNVGNCMAGYGTNHGVFTKKFYYITPSGNKVDAKLVKPLETGTYIVAMAVADEYKAWSDWYDQELIVNTPAPPNNPPTVYLTDPAGSYANPTQVSLLPTIRWNQADPDPGTIYSTFNINVKDEWGNCIECITNRVMDTTSGSWSWTMDNSLAMGQKYQVQVQISDGEAWSGWSNIGWMATNSPPAAAMSFPYGTQAAPNIIATLRPTLTWHQTDPDAGARFDYFQIQITNEANNVMILDSGKLWQGTTSTSGSWVVPTDLPAGQKLRVRVMVWDQYGSSSPWSAQTWMMINRPPHADFTWSPQPANEGDTITIVNQSSDPDGDTLTYNWHLIGPAYDSLQMTVNALIPSTATDFHPGGYSVTLTATDPYGAADTITKIIPVGDLQIAGYVRHTPQWELNRKVYNRKKTGEDERPRSSAAFWAGEAFVLAADTNEPALQVYTTMSYTGIQDHLTTTDHTAWSGQIFRNDFELLPDAEYVFRFTAVWPNGHTEEVNRIVAVDKPWTDFTSSVRKQ